MNELPPVGSHVWVLVAGPVEQPVDLYVMRVISLLPTKEGVVVSVQNSCTDRALLLADESILWTRSADPADWVALRAAYALAQALA